MSGSLSLVGNSLSLGPSLSLGGGLSQGATPNFTQKFADFDLSVALHPRFSLTRASSATYWNGTALATAGSNVARFDAPGGPSGLSGLLIEPQVTNLFLNSQSPATQGVATTAQQYTLSGWGNAGATITLSGTATGVLTGTGAGNQVSLTVTATAGTLTCTVAGTWTNVQVETGAIATSRIVTAGATVTRAADVLTYTGADSAQSMILTASDGTTQELHKDPFVPWVINPLNLNKYNVVKMQTGAPNALFGFDVVNTTTVSGNLSTAAGTTVTIYWGDGTSTALSGSSQAYSKTYSAAVYKSVVIKGPVGALTTFTMDNGSANVAFNLSSLPSGMTYFNCQGNNTVSGSVSSLPSGMTYFNCQGNNTINAYTTKTWANNQDTVKLVPVAGGGLSAGSIDQLCIDLANVTAWTGGKTLYLKGTNAAPTVTSAAARATIAGNGVTVTTN